MSRGDGHGFWAEGREEALGSGEMIGTVQGSSKNREAPEKRNPEGIERERRRTGRK